MKSPPRMVEKKPPRPDKTDKINKALVNMSIENDSMSMPVSDKDSVANNNNSEVY